MERNNELPEDVDRDTIVARLKNGIKRHGCIEEILAYRDHGDRVFST